MNINNEIETNESKEIDNDIIDMNELLSNLNENIDKIENDMDSLTMEFNKFQNLLKRRIELLDLIQGKNEN
jgi:uncharacterized protein YlxW (UPF0749 family)